MPPPSRVSRRLLALVWLMLAGSLPASRAQDLGDDEPFLPGLVATYRDAKGHTATRLDAQLAFDWGARPDQRLDEGAFQATWRGHVYVHARGDYRFFVFGTGVVELKVAGRVVVPRQALDNAWRETPPVVLPAEFQSIELSFWQTKKEAGLKLMWSGPNFGLEPIPPRFLYHPREQLVPRDFERGELLARVLRCGRCHDGEEKPAPGPALDRLAGNLSRDWLVRWLAAGEHTPSDPVSPRRMPTFGLNKPQAEAIAAWLVDPGPGFQAGAAPARAVNPPAPVKPSKQGRRSPPPKPSRDAKTGERLFLTLGCLACHSWRDLGASGWLGGGDLTQIAEKRPPSYFATWLDNPGMLNRDHRMPVFALSEDERTAIALFLADQRTVGTKPEFSTHSTEERRAEGKQLVEQFRCGACHQLPGGDTQRPYARPLSSDTTTREEGCLGAPDATKHRPGYRLGTSDAQALRAFYAGRRPAPEGKPNHLDGRLILTEYNCLACHAREGARELTPLLSPLLTDKLTAVGQLFSELAALTPALTPPALNSVGDKLTEQALIESITRRDEPHRPYLQVRMPRFPLRDEEVQALVRYLVAVDRIPERTRNRSAPSEAAQQDRYTLAGGRLVSSDGFGCTSCHAVGRVEPSEAPISARGPSLSRLEQRIRRPWFDRFVHDPARIVPRMEMPSVQIPVPGVLDSKLDEQLAAVWHVLNQPGFQPPRPNPIRTLRHHGNDFNAAPLVLTDHVQHDGKTRIKPFLVGLSNRHNVLFDLETANLALWTTGDAARQRTKGKTWFWELAGAVVLDTQLPGPDLALMLGGHELTPQPVDQFLGEADAWHFEGNSLVLRYRLRFDDQKPTTLHVQRKWTPLSDGFLQELTVGPLPTAARVRLSLLSSQTKVTRTATGRTIQLGDRFGSRISLQEPLQAKFVNEGSGVELTADDKGTVRVVISYQSEVPIDRFPAPSAEANSVRKVEPVEIAPGFIGERLPLPPEIMPSGLTWRPDGRLVFCSLKGQVYDVRDDRLVLLADGLPAPYGVHAGPGYVDVSAKYGLLRLWDDRRVEVIASGWGYSPDYHDWAIGLPQNARGDYFLGIPCQQDKRSPAAARFHGNVLRLTPRPPTTDDPRRFTLVPLSAGHRFPMGLALDRHGELFVTDNQGSYKPFNELNHVRPGAHFGFINALDRSKPVPPRTLPAIEIPHPWTRSVNGICFLDTPQELRSRLGRDAFGPLEGHLIGCEYDTRRLIRMTLQRVGETFQGAAYPLSIPPTDVRRGFLGPLVCAVSPRGELVVGSIRDSGWGAGNNVGEIVRVKIEPDRLPCGIAEVRAVHDGFEIDFFRPIDHAAAERLECYTIQSYRREATPAYGGPDRDRRTEKLTGVTLAPDGRRVTLRLAALRPGFVYEMRLKNLAPGGGEIHPVEAHYTLRVLPPRAADAGAP